MKAKGSDEMLNNDDDAWLLLIPSISLKKIDRHDKNDR